MLVRRILSVSPGDGLQAWHAVTQWFKPRSVVEQAASMARLISPKRTKNVNELQIAAMQWELALVEHESKFSEVLADNVKTAAMRAMLPKDVLKRFLDGPFIIRNFEIVCLHVWKRSWPDRTQVVEFNPWTLGKLTNPKEKTKTSTLYNSAAHMIDPIRNTSDSPIMNENCSTVRLPIRHHRHHANRLHETGNRGKTRRSRMRARGSVSSATGVVEMAIPPDREQMIVSTWMKSEQSRPVILTVICLAWIGVMIPL